MRQRTLLFKNLGLFLLPVLLFIGVLFATPLDKQYAYYFLKNECNEKGAWIYNRVFINDKPIDIAFIGASRTKASFNEAAMEDTLNKQGYHLSVVNLGYCRWGRNMDYALIKDLFKHKKVKCLVLELHEEEERLGHIDFAYIADAKDVLLPVLFFNQNLFSDLYHATMIRFDIFKNRLLGINEQYAARTEDHGFLPSAQVANPDDLANAKRRNDNDPYTSTALEDRINNRFPIEYLQKISVMAKENGCKLFFVYLPGYGAKEHPASSFDYCKPLGTVFLTPKSLLDDPAKWRDDSHFNDSGSLKESIWFVSQLKQYLVNAPL